MKTILLFLMLLTGIKGFSQECPCVKTAIIGTNAKASIVHNNKIVAMGDVEINSGESVHLKTINIIGKATWYNADKEITNTLVSPTQTTEFTVKSSLNGCPDAFDKVVVKVNKSLKEQTDNTVSVYPNPTNDFLTVTTQKGVIESIQINSINGNTLFTNSYKENSGSKTLNISALSSGVYFINIELAGKVVIIKKIIKN